ncbi:uncharacterized protein RJT20DRAFT_44742 [Scheffersomyces xylosifermentans]|uniref:uncharacterized protein n=1 Tax=Scheffersomyces xylosifermentans TaxID=1304137 RepID=UPI00315CE802
MLAYLAYPFVVFFKIGASIFDWCLVKPIYNLSYFLFILVKHAIVIPLQLLVDIMVYNLFIRIPIVIPLKYLLELNGVEHGEDEDFTWLMAQLQLFVVNAFHYLMVSAFLGVAVGAIMGFNLVIIRYLFTWGKNKKKSSIMTRARKNGTRVGHGPGGVYSVRNNKPLKPRSNISFTLTPVSTKTTSPRKDTSVQTTPFLSGLINSVIVGGGDEPVKATGSKLGQSNANLRNRLGAHKREESAPMYEDDDGYNYNSFSSPQFSRIPQKVPSRLQPPYHSIQRVGAQTSPTGTDDMNIIREEDEEDGGGGDSEANTVFSKSKPSEDYMNTINTSNNEDK